MIATRRLYLLLALGIVLFSLTAFSPYFFPIGYIYDAIIFLIVVSDWFLTPNAKNLEGTRAVTERLSIGRSNLVELTIQNKGTSTLSCRLKDDFPQSIDADIREFEFSLEPSSTKLFRYQLKPSKRGAYKFNNINIRYRSFLGLFWRSQIIASEKAVKVYSDLQTIHDLSVKLSRSTELGTLRKRRTGQGTDFSSLREYTVGDDSKAIDWKATARKDRPVVRTFDTEQEQRLLILIDAGRMMISDLEGLTKFDHALNAALCLAVTGLAQNDQVGLGIFADKPLAYLPPKRGKAYLKKMLEISFNAEPRMVEPDYVGMLSYFAAAQKGRSLIVLFTDLTDPTGSHILLSALAALSPRHLPFCITLKDRLINAIAETKIQQLLVADDRQIDMDQLYRRAVATDLLSQREVALNILTRRGCLVLDCAPIELSTQIVDAYLDIKTRALL